MPRLRTDAVLIPKVSWTQNDAPAAVSYGALVGTPNTIVLVPRAGAGTAGFTLTLQWTGGEATLDDITRLVGGPPSAVRAGVPRRLGEVEARLGEALFPHGTYALHLRAGVACAPSPS